VKTIFVSCKFYKNNTPSKFVNHCIDLGNIIFKDMDVELQICNDISVGDVQKKIKEKIRNSIGVVFILERKHFSDNRPVCSDYMGFEYAIADGLNIPIAIVNASHLKKPDIFGNHLEEMTNTNSDRDMLKYFAGLKEKIMQSSPIKNAAFRIDSITRIITINSKGGMKFQTKAFMTALQNNVFTFQHFIYKRYMYFDNSIAPNSIPLLSVHSSSRKVEARFEGETTKQYIWDFILDKPLSKNESFDYEFETSFDQFYPMTKSGLSKIVTHPEYPFPEGAVEHHYYVAYPTDLLRLELHFEDASLIGGFSVVVFTGKIYSDSYIDYEETERLKDMIREESIMSDKRITLDVKNPKLAATYAIRWRLED